MGKDTQRKSGVQGGCGCGCEVCVRPIEEAVSRVRLAPRSLPRTHTATRPACVDLSGAEGHVRAHPPPRPAHTHTHAHLPRAAGTDCPFIIRRLETCIAYVRR